METILDSVYVIDGRVSSIIFKNGLTHTFIYKNDVGITAWNKTTQKPQRSWVLFYPIIQLFFRYGISLQK